MEHLEAYVEGKTYGQDGSGFAVILLSKTNEWRRSFAYGNFNSNLAELHATHFALLSIAHCFRTDKEIILNIKSQYVRTMLERDENGYFTKIPKKNKELIEKIRSMLTDNVSIVKSKGERSEICSEMVENAVKNNSPIDIRR